MAGMRYCKNCNKDTFKHVCEVCGQSLTDDDKRPSYEIPKPYISNCKHINTIKYEIKVCDARTVDLCIDCGVPA